MTSLFSTFTVQLAKVLSRYVQRLIALFCILQLFNVGYFTCPNATGDEILGNVGSRIKCRRLKISCAVTVTLLLVMSPPNATIFGLLIQLVSLTKL